MADSLQVLIADYIKKAPDYENRALMQVAAELLKAQAQRLEQAEGEVDGRTWDHRKW
ncbi:MAG: hypothetical protein LKF36_09060 [Lactobacillus sp.]|nr:hypothetical protein [Lactobacillus sp.]